MNDFYPWIDEEDTKSIFADLLWDYFRNPLAYAFAIVKPSGKMKYRIKLIALASHPKVLDEAEVEELENSDSSPNWIPPSVKRDPNDPATLELPFHTLYWGFFRMLHNPFSDSSQASGAEALAKKLITIKS